MVILTDTLSAIGMKLVQQSSTVTSKGADCVDANMVTSTIVNLALVYICVKIHNLVMWAIEI